MISDGDLMAGQQRSSVVARHQFFSVTEPEAGSLFAIDAGGQLKSYEPPMDWTLSGEAKRYIENALIAGTHACAAEANVETMGAVVDRLGR